MRKAAGILMIISGIILIFYYAQLLATYGYTAGMWIPIAGRLPSWVSPVLFTSAFVAAVFVLVGGIFALRRKHWKMCLAANIPSTVFLMLMIVIYGLIGILAILFVCLRKREWQEFQG